MHHYSFNIGNYRRQTGHLTQLEHGIYRSLIDTYYLDENPLCLDKAKLMRSHSVRTVEEKEAFDNILADFFTESPDGYRHEHIEEELEKIYDKSEKARASAKSRWRKEKAKKGVETTQTDQESCERICKTCERIESECGCDAFVVLPSTHNPVPNTSAPKKRAIPICPIQKIADLYNETVKFMAQWRVLSDDTKRNISMRWKQHEKFQNIEKWKDLFDYCENNQFLSGQADNPRPFKADLNWIVKSANFAKILNGKYDNS